MINMAIMLEKSDNLKADDEEVGQIKEMYLKTYQQGREVFIAVCDCDILGKSFREGHLHVEVSPDFFGGSLASVSDVEGALASATMANFVGCKTVEHAIRLGYVERDNVLSIDGVLYAQMVRM
ncbi:Uncharacterised protein [uncultured archaeon]|nr:Uncharacterised protein [uncultured archaeon]